MERGNGPVKPGKWEWVDVRELTIDCLALKVALRI